MSRSREAWLECQIESLQGRQLVLEDLCRALVQAIERPGATNPDDVVSFAKEVLSKSRPWADSSYGKGMGHVPW